MNTDTMIDLSTEQYRRYLRDAAQERRNGQAVIAPTSFATAIRNSLGAAFIQLGQRLQHATPASSMAVTASGR